MTTPRSPGRAVTAALLLAAAISATSLGAAWAGETPAPKADVHPALASQLRQERPLPWVFPVFQRGNLTAVDTESRHLLESLLRHARPGSQVQIASQRWDRYWNRGAEQPLSSFPLDRYSGPDCWPALAEAVNRGVDVAVVQNGRRAKPRVTQWLRDPATAAECPVAPTAKRGEIRVKSCSRPPGGKGGGCLGDGEMRASFFTFEHVDVAGQDLHSVVAITGASFGNRQLHEQNDWIIVVGDQALYDAVSAYFEAMFRASNDAPETGWQGIASGDSFRLDAVGATRSAASAAAGADSALAIAFHPRSDFIQIDALKRVECDPTARIRVLMALPSEGPEGSALIDALRRLGRAGCQVEALLRETSIETSTALIERLAADKVWVVAVPRASSAFFNSRYLLIDAAIAGKRRRLVYTGGASFDPGAATRDDEILVAIEDDEVFRSYEAEIDRLCSRLNCRLAQAR